jgi:hypothetical protein
LKLVRFVGQVEDCTVRSVDIMWEAVALNRLAHMSGGEAVGKLVDTTVRIFPEMDAIQVAGRACAWHRLGLSFTSRAGIALTAAIVRTLPMMGANWLPKVITVLRQARLDLDTHAWAALQEAVANAAREVGPQDFGRLAGAYAGLPGYWGRAPVQHTNDELLAAAQRTLPYMNSMTFSTTVLAFSLIPLPWDSPVGQAVQAETLQQLEGMNAAAVKKTLLGLGCARVSISEPLAGALRNAVLRVTPSFMPDDLVSVFHSMSSLKERMLIPDEVRKVLLEAVSRHGRRLTGVPKILKFMKILDWQIPDRASRG